MASLSKRQAGNNQKCRGCLCRQHWFQIRFWRPPEKKRQEEGRRAFPITSCQKKVWARTWQSERSPRTTRLGEGNVRERESQLCTSRRPNIWPNLEVNNSWKGRGRKERRDTFIQVLWNVRGSRICLRVASDVKERPQGGGGGSCRRRGTAKGHIRERPPTDSSKAKRMLAFMVKAQF